MPEFVQEDQTAKQTIHVHFKTLEDAQKFGELLGQPVTEKTRALWYPKADVDRYADKCYVDADAT